MSMTSIDAEAAATTRCQSTANRYDEEALVMAFLADIQLAARVAGISFEEWPFAKSRPAILSARVRSLESHKLHRLAALAEAVGYQSPEPDADIAEGR